jgi:hypothetical protein
MASTSFRGGRDALRRGDQSYEPAESGQVRGGPLGKQPLLNANADNAGTASIGRLGGACVVETRGMVMRSKQLQAYADESTFGVIVARPTPSRTVAPVIKSDVMAPPPPMWKL